MGPLMIDVAGVNLDDDDKALLKHPAVAGVILFARNYQDTKQLQQLVSDIRKASNERLLIAVDHEGGRVQRFKQGFTLLPPAQSYAELNSIVEAKQLAFDAGWILAMELMAFDIDLSFAPVLDLGHECLAIGTRSFHENPDIAYKIASAMIDGMHSAGMKSNGKHFPGHGAVRADSHKETPIDDRTPSEIMHDMQIFSRLINDNKLDSIMPAHVIYSKCDDKPASGSPYWLKTVLRNELNFKGVIFSDDLSMEGAAVLGNYSERASSALAAGCDILLACNNRQGTLDILANLKSDNNDKAKTLLAQNDVDYNSLIKSNDWQVRNKRLQQLNDRWQTFILNNN
ncbi:beta-N-acetylhexosaminidase [Orbaceae bacterium ac157xtp]